MPPRSATGVRDELLDRALAEYLFGDGQGDALSPQPGSAPQQSGSGLPGGDPKVTLRLSILVGVFVALVSGVTSAVGTFYSLREELRNRIDVVRAEVAAAIDKHAAGPHASAPTRDEVRDLRDKLGELEAGLVRMTVELAEVKAAAPRRR
jgi:hypothetical protein